MEDFRLAVSSPTKIPVVLNNLQVLLTFSPCFCECRGGIMAWTMRFPCPKRNIGVFCNSKRLSLQFWSPAQLLSCLLCVHREAKKLSHEVREHFRAESGLEVCSLVEHPEARDNVVECLATGSTGHVFVLALGIHKEELSRYWEWIVDQVRLNEHFVGLFCVYEGSTAWNLTAWRCCLVSPITDHAFVLALAIRKEELRRYGGIFDHVTFEFLVCPAERVLFILETSLVLTKNAEEEAKSPVFANCVFSLALIAPSLILGNPRNNHEIFTSGPTSP